MAALPKYDDDYPMTEANYLALLDEDTTAKYEWIDGAIYAMSGAKPNHGIIETNLVGILFRELQKTDNCSARTSNTAVAVEANRNYFFPDVSVVCGEPEYVEAAAIGILTNPILIIEVLSDSTEQRDRTTKFDNYRQIATMRDYVLVWQDTARIEVFARREDNTWLLSSATGLDASVHLPVLDVTLSLAEVYQRVNFKTETEDQVPGDL